MKGLYAIADAETLTTRGVELRKFREGLRAAGGVQLQIRSSWRGVSSGRRGRGLGQEGYCEDGDVVVLRQGKALQISGWIKLDAVLIDGIIRFRCGAIVVDDRFK